MFRLIAGHLNRFVGVIAVSVFAAALTVAQSQSYTLYGSRDAWLRAVADAGITPPIGTQTFEGIAPALYPYLNDVGGVSYSSQQYSTVSVAELVGGGHVLRPADTAAIHAQLGPRAIAFDFSIESNLIYYPQCGTSPPTDATIILSPNANPITIPHVHTGFVSIIAPPEVPALSEIWVVAGGPCPGIEIVLLDNVSYPGGPESSQVNPNPPLPCPAGVASGTFCFTPPTAIGPAWYDPPVTNAFDFSCPDGKFTSINDFPTGFASPFTVSSGGVVLGSFTPGQSVQFPNGGVHEFRISGISPDVDGDNPYAFPINLSLDSVGVVFTMRPITLEDDSVAPTLSIPSNISAEATGPLGAVVIYSVSATDDLDPQPTVNCAPSSGSLFALNQTIVHCTATDVTGNTSTGSFDVNVVDTSAPALAVPTDIVVDATSPQGAVVIFVVTAADIVDSNPTIDCSKTSGSNFVVGLSTVQCRATDASGNSTQRSFNVTVNGATTQTANLIGLVQGFNLAQGISNSLDSKLQNILDAFNATNAGNRADACNQLAAFINSVVAQSGHQLTVAQANLLITKATQIMAVQGCP